MHSVLKGDPSEAPSAGVSFKATHATGEPWQHEGATSHDCDLNFVFRSDGVSEETTGVKAAFLPS